jgi:hypothetical protein
MHEGLDQRYPWSWHSSTLVFVQDRHWCTIGVPSFLPDFEITPIEAVRGQMLGEGIRESVSLGRLGKDETPIVHLETETETLDMPRPISGICLGPDSYSTPVPRDLDRDSQNMKLLIMMLSCTSRPTETFDLFWDSRHADMAFVSDHVSTV